MRVEGERKRSEGEGAGRLEGRKKGFEWRREVGKGERRGGKRGEKGRRERGKMGGKEVFVAVLKSLIP